MPKWRSSTPCKALAMVRASKELDNIFLKTFVGRCSYEAVHKSSAAK